MKRKSIVVIVFSSLIVAAVLFSTLLGYMLYVQWKEDSFVLKYHNSIYKLTAELFRENVSIANTKVRLEGAEPFPQMPVLEGSIKNSSDKTVISVLVEISFREPDGSVVYKDWFYPLGERSFSNPIMFSGVKRAENVILPGEGISFRHLLRNCPRELVPMLSSGSNFARNSAEGKIALVCEIKGLRVL